MTQTSIVENIMKNLRKTGVVDDTAKLMQKMNGTTDGHAFTITVNDDPKYVLKLDNPQNITLVERLHQAYRHSPLISKLHYTDPAKTFIVYSFIKGTTHYQRGAKKNWMAKLVKDFLNHYELDHRTEKWGRLVVPRDSWREFNVISVEGARENVGSLLPIEDYERVKSLIENISNVDKKYFMHGDTGVHNFVFHEFELTGVIDPSPMAGPMMYDFTYAFCSSPDDLNVETLFAAFDLLHHESMERSRLIEEVIFQLYCRIGICAKVHPHDLEDYLQAWEYWKALLPNGISKGEKGN